MRKQQAQSSSRPRGRPRGREDYRNGADLGDNNGGMNAGLVERFGRGPATRQDERESERQQQPQHPVNQAIGRYIKKQIGTGAPKWALRPEVPTVDELLPDAAFQPPNNGWAAQNESQTPSEWGSTAGAGHGISEQALSAWQDDPLHTDPYANDVNPPANAGWDDTNAGKDAWDDTKTTAGTNGWDAASTTNDPWGDPTPSVDPWATKDKTSQDKAAINQSDDQAEQNANEAPIKNGWGAEPDVTDNWGQPAGNTDPWGASASDVHVADPWATTAVDAPRDDTTNQIAEPEVDDESFDNVANIVDGPWTSKKEYLRNHYLLMREDALRPLRRALEHVRDAPTFNEDPSRTSIGIYDQVHVCGVTFSARGLGIRVSFSLGCVGKKIHWKQSKRLISGSLVVLMSKDKTICKVATVAARPQSNLEKIPPEIDLFLSQAEDLDIDCSQEWIMIEERTSFYEAGRHTMVALQRMLEEDFPLQEHLVAVQTHVEAPLYVQEQPVRDVSDVIGLNSMGSNLAFNVLELWPENLRTQLDESQVSALSTILTNRLALVQGPPGTGKTFVSVQALKILVKNMAPNDPPIIITCQTNHALDQLLLHVAEFEPKFVRLGGQSKDKDVIAKRTMWELRSEQPRVPFRGQRALMELGAQMAKIMAPLIKGPEANEHNKEVLDLSLLRELGVLTSKQCDLLVKGASEWVAYGQTASKDDPLRIWIGKYLEPVKPPHVVTLLEYEEINEADVEIEEVAEADAEGVISDDNDEIERLKGDYYMIGDTWTGKGSDNKASRDIAQAHLKKDDLWKIKAADRGSVYRHLQRELKQKVARKLRELFPKYEACCQERKIHRWERDEGLLKDNRIIGLTTTGMSKYRPLIASLKPKVVLIEEAAETLEAPVIAACCESVQHLILVGDHKQLRPHCHVHDLEKPPYNLNISLFERMVDNQLEYSILKRQRRMKPEIRRLLTPIYGEKIKDHEIVKTRPPIPGMGGLTTWFFTHEFNDERDREASSLNMFEACMIFNLTQYLCYNGMPAASITVLTFYQGQRKTLARLLRQDSQLLEVKLVTVDSYQGEENDVVILSLVRSNMDGKIGFAGIENRVCVALSRAKRGFYVFGNGQLLAEESKIWAEVITIFNNGAVSKEVKGQKGTSKGDINPWLPTRRIGFSLPLWCATHQRMTNMETLEDWAVNVGGCDQPCGGELNCGHHCPENCHPWSHDKYHCKRSCKRVLACGHFCRLLCSETCVCKDCALDDHVADPDYIDSQVQSFNTERRSGNDPRKNGAVTPAGYANAVRRQDHMSYDGAQDYPDAGSELLLFEEDEHTRSGTGDREGTESKTKHVHRFTDVPKEEAHGQQHGQRGAKELKQDFAVMSMTNGASKAGKKSHASLLD